MNPLAQEKIVHLPLEQPDVPVPLSVAQSVPLPSVTHPPHEFISCWVSMHSYGVEAMNSVVLEIGQAVRPLGQRGLSPFLLSGKLRRALALGLAHDLSPEQMEQYDGPPDRNRLWNACASTGPFRLFLTQSIAVGLH